ncbi:bacteriohemerythrin [Pseudodesulfovibrio pelocollis]|uniref:bacteriohemerythrin n=1 Tax=Pseudodesulfovibrio pelocollis TaxID=3051432 RepID=UPI00255AC42B|nr:bacteriohemerythrin [Pseudodesulfovibrio sp. SB368]
MNISFRLIGSILIIFFIIVGMFAATWVVTSSQESDSLVLNIAGRQRMLAEKLGKEALAFGASGDAALRGQIETTMTLFESSLAALDASGPVPLTLDPRGPRGQLPEASREARAQLAKVRQQWDAYRALVEQGVTSGKPDVAGIAARSAAVVAAMNEAVVLLQRESEGRVTTLLVSQAACVGIGVIIVLLVLYNLRTKLTRPLSHLKEYAEAVAGGDLKAVSKGEYTEELLDLKTAIVTMVDALGETMTTVETRGREAERSAEEARRAVAKADEQQAQVRALLETMSRAATKASDISRDVAASVTQLASQVDEVNHGTDVQRDRMAETATAMEEMNATVLEVARNASNAAQSADRARENARTGAEGVRAAVASIDAIKDQILELNESMGELGKQAENIGKIMNVVTDIADQTNLLALNAAIEAARAGDAGRGFAVVADEVRKLAEKTMQATKEVGDAVSRIQAQARANIQAVETSVQDIVKSTAAANESGQFMAEIVSIVGETAAQVESIATASEEQSAASEEINQAVTDVTRIAFETAQGMTRAAQALDAMAAMAADLDAVIRDMTGDESAAGRMAGDDAQPAQKALAQKGIAQKVPAKGVTAKAAPAANGRASAPAAKAAPRQSDRSGLKAEDKDGIMQWADDLSVNIREVDEQHLRLINLINKLHAAMRSGKGMQATARVLDELKEYTVFHFSSEEALFEEHGYAGLVNHVAAHKAFVNKVLDFEQQILSGKSSVTMEVMNFLKDWLVKHIKGVDKKYSAFFNERGIY